MTNRIHPRLIRFKFFIVISLVALMLSVAIWGAVYLLTSAGMR